jgi:energy-coupling factor transporter ATP-binding protein EcfA2
MTNNQPTFNDDECTSEDNKIVLFLGRTGSG